jgi:hypothetical protein
MLSALQCSCRQKIIFVLFNLFSELFCDSQTHFLSNSNTCITVTCFETSFLFILRLSFDVFYLFWDCLSVYFIYSETVFRCILFILRLSFDVFYLFWDCLLMYSRRQVSSWKRTWRRVLRRGRTLPSTTLMTLLPLLDTLSMGKFWEDFRLLKHLLPVLHFMRCSLKFVPQWVDPSVFLVTIPADAKLITSRKIIWGRTKSRIKFKKRYNK